jgi:tetratricopeptide (TPR) repeat protein
LLLKQSDQAEAAYAITQEALNDADSQKLLTGDRLSLDVLDILGEVYRATKHHDEAVALFTDAQKRYPREPRVLLQLGQAELASGELRLRREARQHLDRAHTMAREKAEQARDPERKTRWRALADRARTMRDELTVKP